MISIRVFQPAPVSAVVRSIRGCSVVLRNQFAFPLEARLANGSVLREAGRALRGMQEARSG